MVQSVAFDGALSTKKSGNASRKLDIFNSKQHFKFVTYSPSLHCKRKF